MTSKEKPNNMKQWLHSDPALVIRRLAALYAALALCRVVFYLYNASLIGPLTWAEIPDLFIGSLQFDTVSILYVFLLWIVLALLPLHAREKTWYRHTLYLYYMIMSAVTVTTNLMDTVYFHYAQKRITAEELFYADNDNTGLLLGQFAAENWYLILLGALITWALSPVYGRRIIPRTPIRTPWIYYTACTLILTGSVYLSIGGIRGGFTRQTRPITLSNATAWTASPTKANLILSNPFCMLRTLGSGKITFTRYYTQEELDAIYTPYHYPADRADTLAPLAGRNVVVFILESFSAEHSALLNPDLYPDGQGFTPFLDSLMRQGYYFPDAHSTGRKSIEALPSILSSIPSYKTPFVLLPQALGPSRPLPKILSDEGYSTAFFCGSARGSMGFGAYATAAGIEKQYGREDYQHDHGDRDYDGYWGIWDEPWLQYMGEVLSKTPQPLFASVFTLSSHHPFVVPAQYTDVLPAGHTKIHKGVSYTDMSIRKFFEHYGGEPWFQNTVFLFSGDHVSSEIYAEKTRTPTGNTHVLSFLYTPDGAIKGRHPGVSQQTDLMPTLLGLMNYPQPYFAFGRDVIGERERYPMAVNYMNQMFQAMTDSVALFFDERHIAAAYARTDTLQRTPLDPSAAAVQEAEHQLKAVIQQYYTHLEEKSYVVRQE